MKVNVLGTDYKIEVKKRSEDANLESNYGYTDTSTKKIVVFAPEGETDADRLADLAYYQERVIRHELVHAALFESGLDNNCYWARDEELVDWIAIQIPKLARAMVSAEALYLEDVFPITFAGSTSVINNS